MVTTFQPLQVAPGRVFVQNDGDVLTSYAVEVTVGRTVATGFQTEATRVFFSRALRPGETEEVAVPVTLPEDVATGPKTVRVRLGTVSAIGTLGTILAQEFFSGRFTVEGLEMLPLPGEPPPPGALGLAPENVTLQQPTAAPQEVQPGDRVTITFPFQVESVPNLPFPVVNVQVSITSNGAVVEDLPVEEFQLSSGQLNRVAVDWVVPSDTPAGPYGAQLRLWDQATLGTLGDLALRNFTSLFQVLAGALPAFGSQDLQVGAPSAQPSQVSPGDTVTFTLPVQIPVPQAQLPIQPQLGVGLDIIDPEGVLVGQELVRTFDVGSGSNPLTLQYTIPSNAPAGLYNVGIQVWDPSTVNTLGVLFDQIFSGIFSVLAGLLPEAPLPQFGRPTLSVSPFSVSAGDRPVGTLAIPNTTPPPIPGAPALPSLTLALRSWIINSAGAVVRNLPSARLDLDPLEGISEQFSIDTSGLSPALYGIRVDLVDFATGSQILEFDFPTGFQVEGVEAPPVVERPLITMSFAGADPRSPSRGDRVRLLFRLASGAAGTPGTVTVLGFPRDAGGNVRGTLRTSLVIGPNTSSGVELVIDSIPEASATGPWSIQMFVQDASFVPGDPSTYLLQQTFSDIFILEAPFVEPEPPPPAPLGFQRGELTLSSVTASPTTAEPGDSVRFLVQFGVANIPVQDEFVRLAVAVLDPNGRGVHNFPEEDFDVTIGQQNRVSFVWPVRSGTSAGRYGLSVRIWDPDTVRTTGLLIDTSRTGLVNIQAAPVAAPAPAPAQLVAAGSPSLRPLTLEAGETLSGLWGVRNTGGETGRAALVLDGPGGGVGPERSVAAGQQVALTGTWTVPSNMRAGRITYGLAIRDLATGRTIGVDSFRITVEEEPEPIPEGIERGQLSVSSPRGSPSTVEPGGITNIGFTITNRSDASASLSISAFPRDSTGRTRGSLRSVVGITPRGSATTALSFRVPSDSPSGPYSIQLFIWDPNTFVAGDTSTFLVNQVFQRTFNVS